MASGRARTLRRLLAALVVVAALMADTATSAWATFKSTKAGSTAFATHGLVAPPQPTCGLLGVLTVRLNWTAPSDASQADVYGSGFLAAGYEVGKSSSAAGPFTYVDNGTSTSYSSSISSGDTYFVVRTYKHSWRSTNSPVRKVTGILFLAATCP
jgi:hypothetical protein